MNEDELRRIYGMYTDSWKFFRKHSDVQETDEYWEQVVSESTAISKKYGECKLIVSLLVATIGELERTYKGKKC